MNKQSVSSGRLSLLARAAYDSLAPLSQDIPGNDPAKTLRGSPRQL